MISRRQFMKLSTGTVKAAAIAHRAYALALLQWTEDAEERRADDLRD